MTSKAKNSRTTVPLHYVIMIAVLVFVGGAIAGILYCGHYVHDDSLSPLSGIATEQEDSSEIDMLEEEVKKNPAKGESWTRLGNLYFDSDQFEKAIAAYRQALKYDPKNADVWTDLGIMYRRSGKPKKAIESFDQAIAEDQKHENARLNKGIVLMYDLKDREGGLRAWEALLKVNPLAMAWEDQSVLGLVEQFRAQEQSSSK